MPGRRCAVFGCNNSKIVSKLKNENIIFHNFPKGNDMVSSTMRNEWIHRCKRADKLNPLTSQICSIHFTENDYERDMRNELLGLPLRKKLKKTAVPTLHLLIKTKQDDNTLNKTAERQKRILKREEKRMVEKLIDESKEFTGKTSTSHNEAQDYEKIVTPSTSNFDPDVSEARRGESSFTDVKEITSVSVEKYMELQNKYEEMKKKFSDYRINKQRKMKLLNGQLRYYKYKYKNKDNSEKTNESLKLLKTILTDNQIAILSKKKKWVKWTSEEISVAFTIRYYSKKCYLYLRDKLHFPLPGLSSLRRWASKIKMGQGILTDVLLFLKIAGENQTDFEKTVVLQFDEVKVKSVTEYDTAEDEVVGPHNQLQVCNARGLFSKWKQPIYSGFDQKMTKDILIEIINELHKINYNVVACVSDCGGSNVGLWNDLSINIDKTYFDHPQTGEKIFMFADAPHLLKLLRNWLLDKGFQIEDRTINKIPLECLVDRTDTEVNVCYKISRKHITCEKSQRQNVKMAAQLLSNTVREALIRYTPGPNKNLAKNVGEFICDVNHWFDIFNSYTKQNPSIFKCAYGVNLQQQEAHLDKMLNILLNMKAIGKNALQIFQKGMIISIRSLKQLFENMKIKFNIDYLCTYKLNQDCLENFFFQLRSRGPNEHPSPLEAMKRMRLIILGKNPGILDANVNTEEQIPEEYVAASVMKTAHVNLDLSEETTEQPFQVSSSSSGSSFGSNDVSAEHSKLFETSDDALEYIAGYLAKKFKHKVPNLGDHTGKIMNEHSYNLPSWVQQLSYGGLIKPTAEWLNKIKKWNTYFEHYHGVTFRKGPLITQRLAIRIKKKEDLPLDLIKAFCKIRTIIRINYINIKKSEDHNKKRKFATSTPSTSSQDQERKKKRKLNKIIN